MRTVREGVVDVTNETRDYKIYEVDIFDSLALLAGLLEYDNVFPHFITYKGVEDGHTYWSVEVEVS
jgi:hypothetical protein